MSVPVSLVCAGQNVCDQDVVVLAAGLAV